MRAILLILFLSYPAWISAHNDPAVSRVYRALTDIKAIESALEIYKSSYGSYPRAEKGIAALVESNILRSLPLDPWGNAYHFSCQGSNFSVSSHGRDGVLGGLGEDFDYSSSTEIENEKNIKIVRSENGLYYAGIFLKPILFLFALSLVLYFVLEQTRFRRRK